MRRLLAAAGRARPLFTFVVAAALIGAVVLQRRTIVDASELLGSLSLAALMILGLLAILDRLLRAEVIRHLMPQISLVRAEVIGDVGAAATKGLPLGGPLGTVLRWQIAKERGVDAVGFLTMLIASAVAAAFVSWGFPLLATVVDVMGRPTEPADVVIITVCVVVLAGALVFWAFVLRSERVTAWATTRSRSLLRRLAATVPALAAADPRDVVPRLRAALVTVARRPFPLLVRMAVVQANGAVILWVALHQVGVGPELGQAEFARVFFVTHVVGSFAPTPGGVGIIEVGLTGALVAAGVDGAVALAAVLIYRFITYVLPIVVGTMLYLVWQRRRRSGGPSIPVGPSVGTANSGL